MSSIKYLLVVLPASGRTEKTKKKREREREREILCGQGLSLLWLGFKVMSGHVDKLGVDFLKCVPVRARGVSWQRILPKG